MGQCLKCILAYPSGDEKMKERHVILLNQLRYLNDQLAGTKQRYAVAEMETSHFRSEVATKELEYQSQINDLQNRLHQQNVIMQQYQIYEKNYHNVRQRMVELQQELASLKQQNNITLEVQPNQ